MTLSILDSDGHTRDETIELVPRVRRDDLPLEPRPEAPITELEPGLWYVDVARIDNDSFSAKIDDLATAEGIVYDYRGYPRIGSGELLGHLIDEPIRSPRWLVPRRIRPGDDHLTFDESSWPVEPRSPRFTDNLVFLTDARAISYAETVLGMIENYQLGPIFGSPSAGTNGNVNPFTLAGGYRFSWTGMKVLKHDGSRLHGVGIRPTDPVVPTVEGMAAGRDEVLEQALERLRAGVSSD
ncbi:MAG: S41 family peptidase [Acidobacteriota bacterium]